MRSKIWAVMIIELLLSSVVVVAQGHMYVREIRFVPLVNWKGPVLVKLPVSYLGNFTGLYVSDKSSCRNILPTSYYVVGGQVYVFFDPGAQLKANKTYTYYICYGDIHAPVKDLSYCSLPGSCRLNVSGGYLTSSGIAVNISYPNETVTASIQLNRNTIVFMDTPIIEGPFYTYDFKVGSNDTYYEMFSKQNVVILKANNVTLGGNDVITWHCCDWFFDGQDDYIEVPHSDALIPQNELTLIVRSYPLSPDLDMKLVGKSPTGAGYVLGHANNHMYPEVWDTAGSHYTFTAGTIPSNAWSMLTITWKTGGRFRGYINTSLVADINASSNPIGYTDTPFVIGAAPWHPPDLAYHGYIASVLLFGRELGGDEISTIYSSKIIDADKLMLFLDPTFYNGSSYVDLSGHNSNGIPYGGLQRVPSNYTWLWIVKGLTSDGKLHLKFFPPSTVIEFYNTKTGAFYESVIVNGSANGAGLIEDFAASLPAGNYNVIAYVPFVKGSRQAFARIVVGNDSFITSYKDDFKVMVSAWSVSIESSRVSLEETLETARPMILPTNITLTVTGVEPGTVELKFKEFKVFHALQEYGDFFIGPLETVEGEEEYTFVIGAVGAFMSLGIAMYFFAQALLRRKFVYVVVYEAFLLTSVVSLLATEQYRLVPYIVILAIAPVALVLRDVAEALSEMFKKL